jgi:hypothetical protein
MAVREGLLRFAEKIQAVQKVTHDFSIDAYSLEPVWVRVRTPGIRRKSVPVSHRD